MFHKQYKYIMKDKTISIL